MLYTYPTDLANGEQKILSAHSCISHFNIAYCITSQAPDLKQLAGLANAKCYWKSEKERAIYLL